MPQPDPMADLGVAIAVLAASGNAAAARVGEALDAWRRSRTISMEAALGYAPGLRAAEYQRNRNGAHRPRQAVSRPMWPPFGKKGPRGGRGVRGNPLGSG
jgi:hypothetical protein